MWASTPFEVGSALKCSGERGQVHTAPCLPLPAARGPWTQRRRSAEPRGDTRQVSRAPTRRRPRRRRCRVALGEPAGPWHSRARGGHWGTGWEAAGLAGGMLASTEPCTALAAAGMGRDGMGGEVRVTSVSLPGRVGPAPHSSSAGRASAWHGQWGRLWQQDGAVLPGWGPRAGGWSGLPAAGPHCRCWDRRWRCHRAGRATTMGLPVPRSWVRTEAELGHDARALRC